MLGEILQFIRSNYMHDDNALFSEFGMGFMGER